MNNEKIIYQLSVEDIQTAAEDFLDRKLNKKELKRVVDRIGDYIPWFDAIENVFLEFGLESKKED